MNGRSFSALGGNKMAKGVIQDNLIPKYHQDGYILLKGMRDAEETNLLSRAAREDRILAQKSCGKSDAEAGTVRLSLCNPPTDPISGMTATTPSLCGSSEELRTA